MSTVRVSVVAPVFNNAGSLPALCSRVRVAFAPEPVEIVLVDDGSSDGSREVLAALDVTRVLHDRNRGQNQAILTGLGAASGEVCCVLDADLEDPPEALPALIAALTDRVPVAFSSRDEPRLASTRLFRRVMRAAFPTLTPHACLCFAMTRTVVDRLLAVAREGDYVVALIGGMGVPTTEVLIQREERRSGQSGYPGLARYTHAARLLWSSLRVRRGGQVTRRGRDERSPRDTR